MVTLAICDVDMLARKSLRILCEQYFLEKGVEYKILQYGSGEALLSREAPDILLTDVKLKRINGILVKEILENIKADTRIIFVAENRNYMAQAFGKNVFAFLVKPVNEKVFYSKMDELLRDIDSEKEYVYCKIQESIEKVRFKDIQYIETAGRGTRVFLKWKGGEAKSYKSESSLKKWEGLLPINRFCRASRNRLVNLCYVVDIKDDVELLGGIKIPMSTNYRKFFLEKNGDYQEKRTNIYRYTRKAASDTKEVHR